MTDTHAAGRSGRVDISESVIATLVRDAVRSCYGVVGIGRPSRNALFALLSRPLTRNSVKVSVEDGRISIYVPIVVEYGTPVGTVARNVIQTVSYGLRHALGIPVERVDVHVTGLRVTSPDQAA